MNRAVKTEPPVLDEKVRRAKVVGQLRQSAPVVLFAICFLVARILKRPGLNPSFADVFILVASGFTTLLVLKERLPLQNIFGIAVTMTFFSGVVFLVEKAFNVSFTPMPNDDFRHLGAWTASILWIIAIVNARGITKFFLQKTIRHKKKIGFWLIGLSSVLVASLNAGALLDLENFLARYLLALIAFVATTPWFIEKKPVEQPPDYQPLFLTVLILLW